jgi:hypothetical protein
MLNKVNHILAFCFFTFKSDSEKFFIVGEADVSFVLPSSLVLIAPFKLEV